MTNQLAKTKTPETICEECVMPMHDLSEEKPEAGILKCVRCPFCSQTVNAVLTHTHISCPKCEVSVALK